MTALRQNIALASFLAASRESAADLAAPKCRALVSRRYTAFTLIEILIAVSIFAIDLGAINTVFFSALRLRNRTQAAMDRALPIEQAVSMIKRDLENICIPNGTLTGQLETTPGTNDVIGATTP